MSALPFGFPGSKGNSFDGATRETQPRGKLRLTSGAADYFFAFFDSTTRARTSVVPMFSTACVVASRQRASPVFMAISSLFPSGEVDLTFASENA